MSALVLGIGNILLGDEGLGVKAVDELERQFEFPDSVAIVDGGTSGIELLHYLRGKRHCIIIDAVNAKHPCGTLLRIEGEEVPAAFRTRISPHQLGLSDLLATATLTDELPDHLVLFGIVPKRIEPGIGLSNEVAAGLEKLLDAVVEKLRSYGYSVTARAEKVVPCNSLW